MSRVSQPVPFDYWLPKRARPEWKQGVIHQQAIFPYRTLSTYSMQGGYLISSFITPRGPISSRGWTLQEHLLSTRVLYFGPGFLYWECLCTMAVDADPSRSVMSKYPNDFNDIEMRRRAHLKCTVRGLPTPLSDRPEEAQYSPYNVWEMLVKEFTLRSLSKPSDRIPAVLAIAKPLQGTVGGEFVGGLWKGPKLLKSLCWKVQDQDQEGVRGPSWAWSSVGGRVNCECLHLAYRGEVVPMATVVSVDVQANQAQSHVSGSVTLQGTLHKKKAMPASDLS